MIEVHFSAGQPWSFDGINCQLRHSILIKNDLFVLNLFFQAAELGFALLSLPLELFDILSILMTFKVEYLSVEVLGQRRSRSFVSVKSGLAEGSLHDHLIMAHPSSVDWIPNQRCVATILIQLVLHSVSLFR